MAQFVQPSRPAKHAKVARPATCNKAGSKKTARSSRVPRASDATESDSWVGGVGCPAGALEAPDLFSMNARDGASVGVQALDPPYRAILPGLVRNISHLRVAQAKNRTKIASGNGYIIAQNGRQTASGKEPQPLDRELLTIDTEPESGASEFTCMRTAPRRTLEKVVRGGRATSLDISMPGKWSRNCGRRIGRGTGHYE